MFLAKYSSSYLKKFDAAKYEIIKVKINTENTLNFEKYNTFNYEFYFFGSGVFTKP